MTTHAALPPATERRAALEARFTPWTSMTLSQALDRAARDFPGRPFFIAGERYCTYQEVRDRSRRLAAGLIELGVARGDHVALVMANHLEFAALKFAIARVGAVCVPINFLLRAAEVGYMLEQSGARVLITMDAHRDVDHLQGLDALAPGWERHGGGGAIPRLRQVVVFSPGGVQREGAMTLADVEAAGTDRAQEELEARESSADASAYCDVLYTSGTTGSPKGVLLKHDQVVRMAYAAAYQRAFEDGRRIAFPVPMYHVFGYVECLIAVIFVGGAVVPQVVFDADQMLTDIGRHGVNEIAAVPAVTLPLLAQYHRGDYDVSSVHAVFSTGGAAPPRIWDDIRDVFGDVECATGYGMIETTASTTCVSPEDDPDVLATCGRLRAAGAAGDPKLGGNVAVCKTSTPRPGPTCPRGSRVSCSYAGPW